MNHCSNCGHKERNCSCERNGRRVIKKMKGMNILGAHLVGEKLFIHLSGLKDEKITYLQIDLKSKEKASLITEGSYQETAKKGIARSEFLGLVAAVEYCSSLDPICVIFALGPKRLGTYFKFTGVLTSITENEADILLRNETIESY